MRRPASSNSRGPSRAAMLLLALPLFACDGGTEALAPDRLIDIAPQADYTAIPGDRDAIMSLVSTATAAWTAKDAAAYAAIYAADVQVVSPIGGLLTGRDGFRAQHVFLFNGPFAGSTQTISVRDIVFLTGTIALVMQDVSLMGYAFLPPNLPASNGVVRNRVTWVVVKRGPSWEIVFQQMTPQL